MRPDLPPLWQAQPTKVEDVQNIRSSIVNSGATCHVCGYLFVDTQPMWIHMWRPRDDAATTSHNDERRRAATTTSRRRRRRQEEAETDDTTLVVRAGGVIEAGDDDDGDDAASRPAEVTTQPHGANVAEMLPPSRADAETRRHGDDEAATTASPPLQLPRAFTIAAAFSCPQLAAAPCSPPASLQCPSPHKSCSSQECPQPQVLVATEPRRCGDTTMWRRRGGHD